MNRIDDLAVAGQAVLLRADLNVPLDGERITDDNRIQATLPAIRTLAGRGARVVICAHLGRPTGTATRPGPWAARRCARSPRGSASCSAGRWRSPPTWPGSRPRPPRPGWPTGR